MSSSSTDVGGSSSAVGGGTGTAATTGGASSAATSIGGATAAATGGASPGTGGATSAATGGVASTATGGATLTPTGGASPGIGGATSAATGGTASVTGGAANVGGTTSNGGSSSSPYLVSNNGWIIDTAHTLEGPLFTYKDPGGSIIDPDCDTGTCFAASGTTSSFCVSGMVAQAVDSEGYNCEMNADYCDWTTYWGAAMAINPNQGPTATTPSAWDASAYTGISFKTAIDAMPPNLRVYLDLVDGTQFCYVISTSKTYTVTWSQFRTDCYTTGGSSPTAADLKQVESIAWQAGTNASAAGAFDFCISDVKITP